MSNLYSCVTKELFIGSIVCFVFLTVLLTQHAHAEAFSQQIDLPSGSCAAYTDNTPFPWGYPVDMTDSQEYGNLITDSVCDDRLPFLIRFGGNNDKYITYSTAYVYSFTDTRWLPIQLSGRDQDGWIQGEGEAEIPLSARQNERIFDANGSFFVASYQCVNRTLQAGRTADWACNCRGDQCNANSWTLQAFSTQTR